MWRAPTSRALSRLDFAPPRLTTGVDPEGHQAERHRDEQPRAERRCGDLAQGAVETLCLLRIERHRGDDQEHSDDTEDDPARGTAHPIRLQPVLSGLIKEYERAA